MVETVELGEALVQGDAVADRVLMLDGTVGRVGGLLVRETVAQAESDSVAVAFALRRKVVEARGLRESEGSGEDVGRDDVDCASAAPSSSNSNRAALPAISRGVRREEARAPEKKRHAELR